MGASSFPHHNDPVPAPPAAPGSTRPAPPDAPPAKVARLARDRRLGAPVVSRKGDNPVVVLGFCGLIAGGLVGVAALINWLVRFLPVRALAIVALLCVLGALFVVAYGFYQLFQGFRATYVFEHGVVWTFNGRPQVATWAEVDRLFVVRHVTPARYVSAELTALDGRTATVAGTYREDDPLIEHLDRLVRAAGRIVTTAPVKPSRQDSGPDTGLADQTLVRMAAVVGVLGSIALAVAGWVAGLPGPVAAVVGPALIGAITIGLAYVVDARLAKAGYVFLGAAGLVLLIVAVKVFHQVNGIIVAVVTLALEGALVAGWRAGYRRLPALRPTGRRRRLAAEFGWQFQPRASSLPVAGPRTARRLIGVATHATTTTGAAVLLGSSTGSAVTVYDRFRRPPRVNDPVQTVWMVRLPQSLPYVASSLFEYLAAEAQTGQPGSVLEHTDDEAFGRAFAAQVWTAATSGPLPPWWIEGGYLYAALEGGSDGAIRPTAERLTGLVAAFPWQVLQRYAVAARPAY